MGQAIDAGAHDAAHRAAVIIRPDALSAEVALGFEKLLRDHLQRLVPRNARKGARAFWAGALQGMKQAILMMNAFGIARDLGADDAIRIGLVFRAINPADAAAFDHLDLKRAGRRAIMRTG